MRTCIMCGQQKREEAFERHKYGRRNQCFVCRNTQKAPWFLTMRGRSVRAQQNLTQAQRIREHITARKRATGCQVCKREFEPVALDFHHLAPGDKDSTINALTRNKVGLARLDAELAKCICVCANCHRKIHAGLIDLEALGLVAV